VVRKPGLFIGAIVVMVCAATATSVAASRSPRLLRVGLGATFVPRPGTISLGCCAEVVIGGPGVSGRAFRSGRRGRIRWTGWGSRQPVGVGLLWIDSCVPTCASGRFLSRPVSIQISRAVNGRYTRLLLIYWSGRRRVFDRRELARVPGLSHAAWQWARGDRLPALSTGTPSSITENSETVNVAVNPHGRPVTYYFQYGTSASYGSRTASAWTGVHAKTVSANLTGLSPGTTYHYRIYASNEAGIAYGWDHTFTTTITEQQVDADRALATYRAMQQYFYAASVYPGDGSSLYAENYPSSGRRYSFLWSFSRALAGTITLAGVPGQLLDGASYGADVTDRLTGLSRYWDGSSSPGGYDSYPPSPYGGGGDKYYDDQAWVGLAAAENYAMTGNPTSLADAKNVFNFAYPGGWGGGASFDPGGLYWVQQGTGVGLTNHDRTTTSNAPNAEIALLLEGFDPVNATTYDTGARAMYGWVNHYLYNVNANPTDPNAPNPNYDPNQPALVFDKVTGSNGIDETLYTYNQGTMIAANVREYQRTGNGAYLSDAEAIARTALSNFNEAYYMVHSAAFNAIFFRGLLVLYAVTGDTNLRSSIIQTIQAYADDAWNNHRSANGLFSFVSSPTPGYQLLDQGALLQIYAMLAWNPSEYANLP